MSNTVMLIETFPFRVSSARYFVVIARMLLKQWWSVALLLLAGLVAATCYDMRFGIVLLMFLFLVVPLILFFVYYNYALRPEAFYSVVEKVAFIDAEGIYCIYDEQQRNVLLWKHVERVVCAKEAFYIYTGRYTYFYLSKEAFADAQSLEYFEQTLLHNVIS